MQRKLHRPPLEVDVPLEEILGDGDPDIGVAVIVEVGRHGKRVGRKEEREEGAGQEHGAEPGRRNGSLRHRGHRRARTTGYSKDAGYHANRDGGSRTGGSRTICPFPGGSLCPRQSPRLSPCLPLPRRRPCPPMPAPPTTCHTRAHLTSSSVRCRRAGGPLTCARECSAGTCTGSR